MFHFALPIWVRSGFSLRNWAGTCRRIAAFALSVAWVALWDRIFWLDLLPWECTARRNWLHWLIWERTARLRSATVTGLSVRPRRPVQPLKQAPFAWGCVRLPGL